MNIELTTTEIEILKRALTVERDTMNDESRSASHPVARRAFQEERTRVANLIDRLAGHPPIPGPKGPNAVANMEY